MKLLEGILVPTDFSPAAEDAVKTAIFVAKQFNSEFCFVHVMPGTVDFCSSVRGMFMKKVDDCLQEIAEQIQAEGIQGVETVVDNGAPFDQIDKHATERDVNVSKWGAGKSTDGGPFRLGTAVARISHKATKPVWIVKPGASPQSEREYLRMLPTCRATGIVIGIPPSNCVSFQFVLERARTSSAKYRGVCSVPLFQIIVNNLTKIHAAIWLTCCRVMFCEARMMAIVFRPLGLSR